MVCLLRSSLEREIVRILFDVYGHCKEEKNHLSIFLEKLLMKFILINLIIFNHLLIFTKHYFYYKRCWGLIRYFIYNFVISFWSSIYVNLVKSKVEK